MIEYFTSLPQNFNDLLGQSDSGQFTQVDSVLQG
jgi:hypothetical protein